MEWVCSTTTFRGHHFECVHFDASPDAHDSSGSLKTFDVQDFRDDVLALVDGVEKADRRRKKGLVDDDNDDTDDERRRRLCRVFEDSVGDGNQKDGLAPVEEKAAETSESPPLMEEEEFIIVDDPDHSPCKLKMDAEQPHMEHKLRAKDKIAMRQAVARSKSDQVVCKDEVVQAVQDSRHVDQRELLSVNFECVRSRVAALPNDFDAIESEIGAVLWRDAADFFLTFLEKYRSSWADTKILELGAGCGYVGLALAADGAEAVITDLDEFVPHMQVNKFLNMEKGAECRRWDSLVQVAACDWATGTIPPGDFDYVICCEVLYACRDVWPGLKQCLVQATHRSSFREILLIINLRVGHKDIDDFLALAADELVAEKIYDNYSENREAMLEQRREELGLVDSKSKTRRAKNAKKQTLTQKQKETGSTETGKSLTEFGLEIYSLQRRRQS